MDPVEQSLRNLKSDEIKANKYSTNEELEKLIIAVGPLTCRNILKAKKDYKLSRIPFLFSSVDPQLVVDVLFNDIEKLLEKIIQDKKAAK